MLTQGTLVEYIREHPAASNGELAELFSERVEIGKMICRILEKI